MKDTIQRNIIICTLNTFPNQKVKSNPLHLASYQNFHPSSQYQCSTVPAHSSPGDSHLNSMYFTCLQTNRPYSPRESILYWKIRNRDRIGVHLTLCFAETSRKTARLLLPLGAHIPMIATARSRIGLVLQWKKDAVARWVNWTPRKMWLLTANSPSCAADDGQPQQEVHLSSSSSPTQIPFSHPPSLWASFLPRPSTDPAPSSTSLLNATSVRRLGMPPGSLINVTESVMTPLSIRYRVGGNPKGKPWQL